jgi:5-(carboxyamino)imidazole ribonucleotide mutase
MLGNGWKTLQSDVWRGCETNTATSHPRQLPMIDMATYTRTAIERGLRGIIAGAGGAALLFGMVASLTVLSVMGVPVESKALHGMDSLLSIVQMPAGIPVATVAI